jgi:hypothetical protein
MLVQQLEHRAVGTHAVEDRGSAGATRERELVSRHRDLSCTIDLGLSLVVRKVQTALADRSHVVVIAGFDRVRERLEVDGIFPRGVGPQGVGMEAERVHEDEISGLRLARTHEPRQVFEVGRKNCRDHDRANSRG